MLNGTATSFESGCEEMSEPAALAADHAREGALHNPSPALGAGKRRWPNFVAAEAVTTKCSISARFCSGRLRGRALPRHFRTPRTARAPSAGLRLLSAPSRATQKSRRFLHTL